MNSDKVYNRIKYLIIFTLVTFLVYFQPLEHKPSHIRVLNNSLYTEVVDDEQENELLRRELSVTGITESQRRLNVEKGEEVINLTKVILFWTSRLDQPDWSRGVGTKQFQHCPYPNCEYTTEKDRLDDADMLLFYCEELPNFPDRRHPRQLYVHVTKEAPPNVKINGYGMYDNAINVTASYRKDGTLWFPYFVIRPKENPEDRYVVRTSYTNRSRSVAWLVSNCNTDSKREMYINELNKSITIDVYGACGNMSCDDEEYKNIDACFKMFEKTYRFYLAFENNICKDYYTEKLANPFRHEIVPIVFGGADYEHDFPEHSLINVIDFPNPEDLAQYLNTMTEVEYDEYLQWKAKYRVGVKLNHCTLCEFLHDSAYTRGEEILPPSYGGSYSKWWNDSCHNDLIYELKEKGGW
ncbi:hypothetical protein LSH36_817g00005 [Paralvinella palmiformis]|uniref:Fucosyltransferase n=1 Tax=Paralvinella palmiformis TaxID=53620 RepID=A0AAD9J0K9_9ANNE|nr:hypothetical protein LSH36_817g00005 [Paralvinella palmiformis]